MRVRFVFALSLRPPHIGRVNGKLHHPIPGQTHVAVTAPEYIKGKATFDAAAEDGLVCVEAPVGEDALARFLREHGIRHVVVGVARYSGALYETLSRGGVLARFGLGCDGIDTARATERGLFCTNTPGALEQSVAEHAVALLIAAARGVADLDAVIHDGEWEPWVGTELHGRRLAVIGCGAIGRRVAVITSAGFGMEVVGCDCAAMDAGETKQCGFSEIVSEFEEAVSGASFVSLHIPGAPGNRHFINEERLEQVPGDAWLINTSRGTVVDEVALYDALYADIIGGACLDVFETEPYQPVDRRRDLRDLRNVVMTPHVGSSTSAACRRMALQALRNIHLAEQQRFDEMDLVNPEILSREE